MLSIKDNWVIEPNGCSLSELQDFIEKNEHPVVIYIKSPDDGKYYPVYWNVHYDPVTGSVTSYILSDRGSGMSSHLPVFQGKDLNVVNKLPNKNSQQNLGIKMLDGCHLFTPESNKLWWCRELQNIQASKSPDCTLKIKYDVKDVKDMWIRSSYIPNVNCMGGDKDQEDGSWLILRFCDTGAKLEDYCVKLNYKGEILGKVQQPKRGWGN